MGIRGIVLLLMLGAAGAASAINVGSSADLSVNLSVQPTSAPPGTTLTYTILAKNTGPNAAGGTRVVTSFPNGVSLSSATCTPAGSGGALQPSNPLVWDIGTISIGTLTCTVTAKVSANASGTQVATSTITSTGAADPNSANNSDTATFSVPAPTSSADVALSLTSNAAPHRYVAGEAWSVQATVSNLSALGNAGPVNVAFDLPAGSVVRPTATCGGFQGGKLTWRVDSLAAGSSQNCTLSGTIADGARTVIVSALATGTPSDPKLSNNHGLVTLPVYIAPKLLTVTTLGGYATKNSYAPATNGNGSRVLFESQDDGLVGGDGHTTGSDLIRVDPLTGQKGFENVDSTGHVIPGRSGAVAIANRGDTVAFLNSPTGAPVGALVSPFAALRANQPYLTADIDSTQVWAGLFGGFKQPVGNPTDGTPPNGSALGTPSVSSDGKIVAWCSSASNLVPGDGNGGKDVFMTNMDDPTHAAVLISKDGSGLQLGDSCDPIVSANGKVIVFTTSTATKYGTGARQVVRKTLSTGALDLISGANGSATTGANADSGQPSVSADGSVIAFSSAASNLDTLGAPAGGTESFVSIAATADAATRSLKRIRSADGTAPNGPVTKPQLSCDGQIAVVQSTATNLPGGAAGQTGTWATSVATGLFGPMGKKTGDTGPAGNVNQADISCDGQTVVFGSDRSAGAGDASGNTDIYTQPTPILELNGDFAGQWYDPTQVPAGHPGHGIVIDVSQPIPSSNNQRVLTVTWYAFVNGQSTWVQGVGFPSPGVDPATGAVTVQIHDAKIFKGVSFPLGAFQATPATWGDITLTFNDRDNATMSWTTSYAGFTSGSMQLLHFLPLDRPEDDPADAQIKACHAGVWYNAFQSGHGFEFGVVHSGSTRLLLVDWFAYRPDNGQPLWLAGAGPINGNKATVTLQIVDGSGAQFPPQFDADNVLGRTWGTVTIQIDSVNGGSVTWSPVIAGYSPGSLSLTRGGVGFIDGRACY